MAAKTPRTYSSEKMTTRRERIIRIARAILAEGGPDALTISRLSAEADAAPSTIYRTFESKEGVILATIADHMTGIRDYLLRCPTKGDLDSIFSEYDWIVAELFRDPAFAGVVIDFYFSSEARPEARLAMRSVAEMRITDWIRQAEAENRLAAGLNPERLIESQIDSEYMLLHKWARHLIHRDKLADELKANFLLALAAAVHQDHRATILTRLAELHTRLGQPPIMATRDDK